MVCSRLAQAILTLMSPLEEITSYSYRTNSQTALYLLRPLVPFSTEEERLFMYISDGEQVLFNLKFTMAAVRPYTIPQ